MSISAFTTLTRLIRYCNDVEAIRAIQCNLKYCSLRVISITYGRDDTTLLTPKQYELIRRAAEDKVIKLENDTESFNKTLAKVI